jgi:hypothetical protein
MNYKLLFFIALIVIGIASFNSKPKGRYFLVGYSGSTKWGMSYSGCTGVFVTGGFPSMARLKEEVSHTAPVTEIYITSLYEFGDKSESDTFWSEK